jgi:glycosyltransferase involved in cell wall biosynthesis
MKILKLSPYYDPEQISSSHLTKDLEEAYVSAGFEIEIYAPTPTRGVNNKIRSNYKRIKYEEKYGGKIKIHRFAMFREGRNPVLRAIRYNLCHVIQYFKAIKVKDIDVIIAGSTPPTQGILVALVKKKLKVPVIYNLQDIFPDSLVNAGLTEEGSLLFKIGKMVENYTYRNADKIIVISEDFKRNIMAKGVPEEKIETVYNWIGENEVVPIERKDNILINKYGLEQDRFYISHCGNIGLSQNMDMLVEVAKELECNPDIMFLIIGDGAYKPELEKRIKDKELKNIILLPFQPYEDIAHVFSIGDVGLVISKSNVGQSSVPSKTWSIMSAERPVLASFDTGSELNRIIESSHCGICVQSDEKDSLINAILWLFENKEKRKQMGEKGREFILNNLSKAAGTGKMINIIKNVINEHRQ